MDLAVRVVKDGDGTYRARVEIGPIGVYTTQGSYGSRGEAREAALRILAAGWAELMARHDPGS